MSNRKYEDRDRPDLGATTISVGDAHNLHLTLLKLDGDEQSKLSWEARLAFAIAMNALTTITTAYERQKAQLQRDAGEDDLKFRTGDIDLRAAQVSVKFKKIPLELLNGAENPHIKGLTIAMLAPILSDLGE